jgi:hypothetical protein
MAQDLPRITAFADLNLRTLDLVRASGDQVEAARRAIRGRDWWGGPLPWLDLVGFGRFVDRIYLCTLGPVEVM